MILKGETKNMDANFKEDYSLKIFFKEINKKYEIFKKTTNLFNPKKIHTLINN